MLRLAGPLALSELGWLLMFLTDTIMVGHLPYSAIAIGAVSVGATLFYTVGIFGSSIMLGLDTLIAQAYGAGKLRECHRYLFNALYFALVLAPALMLLVFAGLPWLNHLGVDPAVVRLTIPFVRVLNWSTLPLVLYFVLRRYLQSMSVVRPVVFALITANLVNLAGNWALIYGHLGLPAMGVTGSAWSTFVSRIYMVLVLMIAVLYNNWRHATGLWTTSRSLEFARIRRLLQLGFPAAVQPLLEISAFTAATVLIGRLGAVPLAGHQIAMNVASATYMIPLGISSAAAVRVGQALGGGDIERAARSGWMALLFGAGFMSCSAVVLFSIPRWIARIYTSQPEVISAGATLLIVAAFFQLFDGVQVVATGALRGAGNTHTPTLVHLLGYWIAGMPLGFFLCFKLGWGAPGFWIGLCIALISIGCILLTVWQRLIKRLAVENRVINSSAHRVI